MNVGSSAEPAWQKKKKFWRPIVRPFTIIIFRINTKRDIVLTGTEVKSAMDGRVQLKEAYVSVREGEAWLFNAHISPYSHGNRENHDPLRTRKLLLHKREISRLDEATAKQGMTLVPTQLYLKNGRIKIEVGVARGKKLYDKREAELKRTVERETRAQLKERNRIDQLLKILRFPIPGEPTHMQVEASRGPIEELDVQALAVAVFKNEKADDGFLKKLDELSGGLVRSALDAEEFSGKEGETAYFHLVGNNKLESTPLATDRRGRSERLQECACFADGGNCRSFFAQ